MSEVGLARLVLAHPLSQLRCRERERGLLYRDVSRLLVARGGVCPTEFPGTIHSTLFLFPNPCWQSHFCSVGLALDWLVCFFWIWLCKYPETFILL